MIGVGVGQKDTLQPANLFRGEAWKAALLPRHHATVQQKGGALSLHEETVAAVLAAASGNVQMHAHAPFCRAMARFRISSAVVVNSTHSTAMAMPTDTLPCSNSRTM